MVVVNFSKPVLFLRFGTAAAADGLDSSKQSEDLKRKARAERLSPIFFHVFSLFDIN